MWGIFYRHDISVSAYGLLNGNMLLYIYYVLHDKINRFYILLILLYI